MSNQPETANSSESNKRIFDFLRLQPVGVLATVDPDDNPHAAVIYYSVDEDFNVTFLTKRDTKKRDNLARKNHAMLVAFDAKTQTTCQITGVTEDVSYLAVANEIFQRTIGAAMATSESGIPPISKLSAGEYVAYRLKPKQINMSVYLRPDRGDYEMFEYIKFED